jgi:hypothetical protein
VLRPPREQPTACFRSPFSACCGAVRFHMSGVDHLRLCGPPIFSKSPKQIFPDPALGPASKRLLTRDLACRALDIRFYLNCAEHYARTPVSLSTFPAARRVLR